VTIQNVFLADAARQNECRQIFREHYGLGIPVTNFVVQAPCDGAALAIEAWAVSGASVRLKRYGAQTLAVSYDGMRWVYCGGIELVDTSQGAYQLSREGFRRMQQMLARAESGFEHIVRTWLYIGGITQAEGRTARYQELNRARGDFYEPICFGKALPVQNGTHNIYPASTGIGTSGSGIVMSCMALETQRKDICLVPLENPLQTRAYAYSARYSPHSPKFSRGMALATAKYVTTWISGTASIVNSETVHAEDIEAQTEQTIENIERLVSAENFRAHGLSGAGATLNDLAKVRIYLKHARDLAKCRRICERRLGGVPSIYVTADVCRPDLLVEIEGVAFSKRGK
jgi:enamine deaminase RidA (YjgF/YER057c/UK114 family)